MKNQEDGNTELNRGIPRNPNQKMSDDEIEALLQLAAAQVSGDEGEKKRAEEAKREKEAEKKRAEEARKQEIEKRRAAEEKKRVEEAEKKRAEEARKQEIERRRAAEEKKREAEGTREKQAGKAAAPVEAKNLSENKSEASTEKQGDAQKFASNPDFIEQEVFVTKAPEIPREEYEDPWTFGRVVGTFLEFLWTMFKLAVVIAVVTVISGVFLSRELMIRGRNGNRQCLENMQVSSNVSSNKSREQSEVDRFLERNKRKKLTMETDDGRILVARKIENKKDKSDKWAVILHGYGETMEDVYDLAMHYHREGYNILLPDLRAHGESEGSFYGMGWLDRLDVINWIDVILQEKPSAQVVVHGVDVGADTALMLAGEPLKSNIKAVVAEGAYTDAWTVVKQEYKTRHEKLPAFPFLVMINPVMKVWAGYTLFEADAVKQVAKANVPILLIHGLNDTYATEDMTDELNAAIASAHKTVEIANGAHGDCRYADTNTYYNETFQFLNTYAK